jgi:prolyl 4-hydroxylase
MTCPTPAVELANDLLMRGASSEAVAILTQSVKSGDPEAAYTWALWHVYGHPVKRDFVLARILFKQAGNAGHAAAARTHAVFTAIGAGGPASWANGLALLRNSAKCDPVAAQEIDLISRMRLNQNGMPEVVPKVEPVAKSPELFAVRSCFTAEECAHVIKLSMPRMVPSVVVDPATGKQSPNPIRTSDGTVLGPIQQDLVIHALNLRIAALTGTCEEQGEPLSVLRYAPNQQYKLHHDCLPGETNQRESTFIAYLNRDYSGGATQFPAANLSYRGDVGDAIIFKNIQPNGSVDTRSQHAGLPVMDGEKWICTRWIRRNSFDRWGMRPR